MLYTVNTTSVQVFRCLGFSSRNCIFLATSQLKRRLERLRYCVGLMFPLNLLLHFFIGISLNFWNPALGKPCLQFSWHVCSERKGSHSFCSALLNFELQDCVHHIVGPISLAVGASFLRTFNSRWPLYSLVTVGIIKLLKQIYIHNSSNLSAFIGHSHFPSPFF